ncbi:MAG TPA: urease accessory protein UreD [Stellaceae bacterium]|jgi:urease accessory protein|nr:urease accessory protein UreD [Stellaceae bacterium]
MSVAISRYEAPAAARGSPPPLERGDGAAEIVFARRGAKTALKHLYQRTPCRVLFPDADIGDPALAVLLTTSGGLTGGDSIRINATAMAGAAATLATQAAEKLYRSLGAETCIDVTLAVEAGAYLEYLPQETILFNGARLARRTHADVAPGGRLLSCEMLVFGRAAHNERLTEGSVYDGWRLRRDNKLVWADALALDGDIGARLESPFAFAGAEAMATAIYAGDDAAAFMPFARKLAENGDSRGGVTLVRGIVLARFFGTPAAAVRADLSRYLRGFRAALGWPARLPRVWSI